ncbi:MAG: N-6 DNA methylase, partial [Nanoarchaeota archaeon]|nr:N-6 DNA methylase [Nanoarchaeota archaeon]
MKKDKISQAYVNIHNRGSFFSEYFLGQLLQKNFKGKLGENDRKGVFFGLMKIYDGGRKLSIDSSLANTWQKWSYRFFFKLGFPEPLEKCKSDEIISSKDQELGSVDGTPLHKYSHKDKPLILFKLLRFGEDPDKKCLKIDNRKTTHFKHLEIAINSSESAKWGIIFNGKILRLIKSDQATIGESYLEFDVDQIMETDSEEEFNVLYAILRKNAFIEEEGITLIDEIAEKSKAYSAQVNESLRESVFEALELILKGIVSDNTDIDFKSDLRTLYEEGLTYLYRLLFVLYAESRGLLPLNEYKVYRENYSLERLRDQIDNPLVSFHPNTFYIWNSLKSLAKLIHLGINTPELKVSAFDGKLFDNNLLKFLNKCSVNDEIMRRVLLSLSRTKKIKKKGTERVAYNELDVAQLGSVYEGLLEFEPKIAEEYLVVVKDSKGSHIIPQTQLSEKDIIEQEIIKGDFYLSLWGGKRKGSGSYYTPEALTSFLVKQAIDPLVSGKSPEQILKLKIVDPAMGSAAFLVAATKYLADVYLESIIKENDQDDSLEYQIELQKARRTVAEHCIYGVDLNPMAVELAKVSMWLITLQKGKPLSFLDHRLKCGNSLIGAKLNNLSLIPNEVLDGEIKKENAEFNKNFEAGEIQMKLSEMDEFQVHQIQTLQSVIRHRKEMIEQPDDSVRDVKIKEELLEHDLQEGSEYMKQKIICDLWCSTWFWPEDSEIEPPTSRTFREIKKSVLGKPCKIDAEETIKYLEIAKKIATEQRFFHWENEFPEIFLDDDGKAKENPGFSIAVGNPPWDKVKPFQKEFFGQYDSSISSQKKKDSSKLIKQLLENDAIKMEWIKYSTNFINQSNYYKKVGFYCYQGIGEYNTYKLFAEQFFRLIRVDGLCSIILPSSIHSDKGTYDLRKLLLNKTKMLFLLCFDNERKIFPGVMHSVKFDFIGFRKMKDDNNQIKVAFKNWTPIEEITNAYQNAINMDMDFIKKTSPDTLSIIDVKSKEEIVLIDKIFSRSNYLKDIGFQLYQELHMTNDRHLFNTKNTGMPLYEGKMINQYRCDFAKPKYWISDENIANNKKIRNSDFRIVIRSVASEKDERTLMATLLPKAPHSNSIISLTIQDENKYEIYLYSIGFFNSLIIDRIIKYKVS